MSEDKKSVHDLELSEDEKAVLPNLFKCKSADLILARKYSALAEKVGHDLFKRGHKEQGLKYYRKAVSLNPEKYEDNTILGEALYKAEHYEEAILHMEKSLETDDNHANRHYLFARHLQKMDLDEEAETHYKKAIEQGRSEEFTEERGERYARYAHDYGMFLYEKERYDEALSYVYCAVIGDGDTAAYDNNLGCVLTALGKNKSAKEQFTYAVRKEPENPVYLTNLGHSFNRLGYVQEAYLYYSKAEENCNTDIEPYRDLKKKITTHKIAIEQKFHIDPKDYLQISGLFDGAIQNLIKDDEHPLPGLVAKDTKFHQSHSTRCRYPDSEGIPVTPD